jgi:hypothetical protein
MKRDMDTVRKFLIKISEEGDEMNGSLPGKGFLYYLSIMEEAELITVEIEKTKNKYSSEETSRIRSAVQLTWKGNDLLEKITDEEKWERIKEVCRNANVSISINAIYTVSELIEGNMLNRWRERRRNKSCLKKY